VIRPEHAVISGTTGLIVSLEAALQEKKRTKIRAHIWRELQTDGGFERLLNELQASAVSALDDDALPPTIVIPIDQAEELFSSEGQEEANAFLSLLGRILVPPTTESVYRHTALRRVIAILAMRSDSYGRLQQEPRLARMKSTLFDLRPLSTADYKAVIEGPAKRATMAGQKLAVDPLLTEKLLNDAAGVDALPLLAFTLEHLLVEYGGDGDLLLQKYETLGGISGAINKAIEASFADPDDKPKIPVTKSEQERLLRLAFIPWLAQIDPYTEERKRRVARWEEIPAESQPLIERLIDKRLLRDRRSVDEFGKETIVVEVAHEVLLRQWNTLAI
jgi:hypothetical protein